LDLELILDQELSVGKVSFQN